MSDENLDEQTPDESSTIRQMREQLKEAERVKRENEELRRNLAFSQAGIDTSDPRQAFFAKGYDGDMTPEAVKKAAIDLGFMSDAPTQPTPDPALEAEREAHAAQMQTGAGTGTGTVDPHTVDPLAELRNYPQNRSPEDFAMQVAQTLAARGDEVAYAGPQSRIIPRDGTPTR